MRMQSVDEPMGEKHVHTMLVIMQTGRAFWRKVWQYLIKSHMHLPFDPVISFLGIYSADTPLTTCRKKM